MSRHFGLETLTAELYGHFGIHVKVSLGHFGTIAGVGGSIQKRLGVSFMLTNIKKGLEQFLRPPRPEIFPRIWTVSVTWF